jgi:hypothetical protein
MKNRFDRRAGLMTRRTMLRGAVGVAGVALAGCGGGGGGEALAPVAPPPSSDPVASGTLVYRNSGVAALWDCAAGRELEFDPGIAPFVNPGMTVSRAGVVCSALDGDNDGFAFALFDLAGRRTATYDVRRAYAFQTGAVVFNADASRIALSLDEPTSGTNADRIARTLVASWPSGTVLALIDGVEEPVWAGSTGELVVRDAEDNRLRLFDAALDDRGALGDLTVLGKVGAYELSADGRFVVCEDATLIRAYDRSTGTRWVAAERDISDVHSPCLSPDGRFLATLTPDATAGEGLTYVPHVLPFAAGATVEVDSARHALDTIAECRGRIGWTA